MATKTEMVSGKASRKTHISANGRTTSPMASESTSGAMVTNTKANGSFASDMVMDATCSELVIIT